MIHTGVPPDPTDRSSPPALREKARVQRGRSDGEPQTPDRGLQALPALSANTRSVQAQEVPSATASTFRRRMTSQHQTSTCPVRPALLSPQPPSSASAPPSSSSCRLLQCSPSSCLSQQLREIPSMDQSSSTPCLSHTCTNSRTVPAPRASDGFTVAQSNATRLG